MRTLLLLLITVPLIELWLLLVINDLIGLGWTVALVIFTAVLGSIHVRAQGFKVLTRIRTEAEAGRMPGEALTEGLLILAAGLLLMTPGVLTDLVGFSFLFPPTRRPLARLAKAWVLARFVGSVRIGGMPGGGLRPPEAGPEIQRGPPPRSAGEASAPPRSGEIIVDAKTVEYTDRKPEDEAAS